MDNTVFDALTRRAAAVSRRSSLLTLGGAALGAVVAPALAEAKKGGKGKAKKKCQAQVGKCKNVVRDFCDEFADVQGCLDALFPCCDPLKTCNATASTQCFIRELFSRN
jgi:hypothetical protein